jgi:hypothetical protein
MATKASSPLGPGPFDSGSSRKHVVKACEDSLRRLGTDYIDLYQMHRYDDATPLEETLSTLNDLVRAGQGPLHRRLELDRLADRRGVLIIDAGLGAAGQPAAAVQHPEPATSRSRSCPPASSSAWA